MSFVKIGGRCFQKSKIVCIEVSHRICGGYNLLVQYNHPYIVPFNGISEFFISGTTMDFNVYYSKKNKLGLVRDVDIILRGNPDCLFDEYSGDMIQSCRE